MMRTTLTLIGGSSFRATTSAAALVTCGFLLAGYGAEFFRAMWMVALWLMAFSAVWFFLALAGSLAGTEDGVPGSEDADRG